MSFFSRLEKVEYVNNDIAAPAAVQQRSHMNDKDALKVGGLKSHKSVPPSLRMTSIKRLWFTPQPQSWIFDEGLPKEVSVVSVSVCC